MHAIARGYDYNENEYFQGFLLFSVDHNAYKERASKNQPKPYFSSVLQEKNEVFLVKQDTLFVYFVNRYKSFFVCYSSKRKPNRNDRYPVL